MNLSLINGKTSVWTRRLLATVLLAGPLSAFALELSGELHWAHRVELSVPVKGVIKAVPVRAGDTVAKGQRLLILDQRPYTSRLKGVQAEVKGLKAVRDEMQRELDRSLELYDRTVLSEHELQVAKNNLTSAEAGYQKGLAALRKARLELEYSELKAPFAGIIVSRHAEAGQVVVSDLQPVTLMVLAANDVMQAWSRVTASDLGNIRPGSRASVKLAGQTYPGLVSEISLEPDSRLSDKDKYYRLVVEFKPANILRMRAGLPVKVILP